MMTNTMTTAHPYNIRYKFGEMLKEKEFTQDRLGQKTLEIIGAAFNANDNAIFWNTKPRIYHKRNRVV